LKADRVLSRPHILSGLQVCALWHSEMWLRGGGGCVVVEGLSQMGNRFPVPCVVCGRSARSDASCADIA